MDDKNIPHITRTNHYLVDEYDKPMLQAINNDELQREFRNTLKPFYGALKTMDGDIKFALGIR